MHCQGRGEVVPRGGPCKAQEAVGYISWVLALLPSGPGALPWTVWAKSSGRRTLSSIIKHREQRVERAARPLWEHDLPEQRLQPAWCLGHHHKHNFKTARQGPGPVQPTPTSSLKGRPQESTRTLAPAIGRGPPEQGRRVVPAAGRDTRPTTLHASWWTLRS